jgi:hypothetical protein
MNTIDEMAAKAEEDFLKEAEQYALTMAHRLDIAEEKTGLEHEAAWRLIKGLHAAMIDKGQKDHPATKALEFMSIIGEP